MNVKRLTTSAVMIALAVVLSMYAVFKLQNGGAVTIASMAPIIYIAMVYDFGWAVAVAIAYSLLQMVTGGFYPPPAGDLFSYVLEILLDYVIAFGVLSLAGVFLKMFKNRVVGIGVSTAIVIFLRFVCHFLSGILVWQSFAPEGQSPMIYSLFYNGSYMSIELLITTVVMVLLSKFILKSVQK